MFLLTALFYTIAGQANAANLRHKLYVKVDREVEGVIEFNKKGYPNLDEDYAVSISRDIDEQTIKHLKLLLKANSNDFSIIDDLNTELKKLRTIVPIVSNAKPKLTLQITAHISERSITISAPLIQLSRTDKVHYTAQYRYTAALIDSDTGNPLSRQTFNYNSIVPVSNEITQWTREQLSYIPWRATILDNHNGKIYFNAGTDDGVIPGEYLIAKTAYAENKLEILEIDRCTIEAKDIKETVTSFHNTNPLIKKGLTILLLPLSCETDGVFGYRFILKNPQTI